MKEAEASTPHEHREPIGATDEAVRRAEDIVADAGKRLGSFLATASLSARKSLAAAREGAEDLWADAQSVRRGETP